MNKRGPSPKIFLVLTILTILAGSALAYMQYASYGEISADVQSLRKTAKDPVDVQAELDQAIAQLNETRSKLTHLEQSVPEMEYVPTMLKELEKLGKDCGIEVTGVRPIPRQVVKTPAKTEDGETSKKARKPYNELDIEVKGRGHYGSVMKFIHGLTVFPKIVAARTVSLQPKIAQRNQEAGGTPKLDVTIELRSFLFPADGSTKKVEEAEEATGEKSINLSSRNKMGANK